MTSVRSRPQHPYVAMLDEFELIRTRLNGVQPWSMTANEIVATTRRLNEHANFVDAVLMTILAEGDRRQVGDPIGHANTAGWFAAVSRVTKPEARRAVALARTLDEDGHSAVRESMLRGELSRDQAFAITRSVDELPADLTEPHVRELAEKDLVGLAEHHDPRELRILGRKILEVHAPEIADQALARVLEAEEEHAAQTASFTMRRDGHGSMVGRFKIPLLAGRMLEKHLAAIASPRHQNAGPDPKPWRWGTAFTEYVETRPTQGLPKTGGIAATMVVTMTLESLLGGLKAADLLDTGEAISAAEARRLACQAGIIPAVLGTKSQVLDLGRKTRLHTEPQRIAIALRDQTCIVDGCDRGPAHAHFHHLDPWAHGGGTSVDRGAMVCGPHHRQLHDQRYAHDRLPNGKVGFHRRT